MLREAALPYGGPQISRCNRNQLVIEPVISVIAERTCLRHVTVIVLRKIDIGEFDLCE